MNKVFFCILFLLSVTYTWGQKEYGTLKDALENPEETVNIVINSNDKELGKFYSEKEKFEHLNSVYIRTGFTPQEFEKLLSALTEISIDEIVWESSQSFNMFEKLTSVTGIDKLIIENAENISSNEYLLFNSLKFKTLYLKSKISLQMPDSMLFYNGIQELGIITEKPTDLGFLPGNLITCNAFTSLSVSVDNVNNIPSSATQITTLKNIDVIKCGDIEADEDQLKNQNLWVNIPKGEGSLVFCISYTGIELLSETEKTSILTAFPNASFTSKPSEIKQTKSHLPSAVQLNKISGCRPTVQAVDIPRKVFTINPNQANRIHYSSGTVILIPRHAFKDKNGNIVKDEVDVTYREMKTSSDILISGVPMAYDSSGKTFQFQSAGNFEILAFKDGESLSLRDDKEIGIDFVSQNSISDMNLYQLDPVTKDWSFKGTANNKESATEVPEKDENGYPQPQPENIWDNDTAGLKNEVDFSFFEDRFYSSEHFYLLDKNEEKGKFYFGNETEDGDFLIQEEIKTSNKTSMLKLIPTNLKEVKKDSLFKVKFKLRPKKEKKKGEREKNVLFPELGAIEGVTFTLTEEMTKTEFKEQFTKKIKYCDIRIEYEKGSNYCEIILKKSDGSLVTLEASVGNKFIFQLRYANYKKKLKKREKQFNNYVNFKIKQERIKAGLGIGNSTASSLTRSFRIRGLGVYNCDQIFRLEGLGNIVTYNDVKIDSENGTFEPEFLYVVDSKINGVLTFTPATVSFIPTSAKTIVAVDKNNEVYYTNTPQNIASNTFNLQKMNKSEISTSEQLNKLIGL